MATTQRDLDVGVQPHGPATRTSRWQRAVGILGLGVVLWVGNNLFDTVTSGGVGDRPGGHAPPGQTPASPPNERDDTAPGVGGDVEHDPAQFDHP